MAALSTEITEPSGTFTACCSASDDSSATTSALSIGTSVAVAKHNIESQITTFLRREMPCLSLEEPFAHRLIQTNKPLRRFE